MNERPKFGEVFGAAMSAVAMLAVTYVAIAMDSEPAQGALFAVVAAAVGFFLRGRVEKPTA